MLKDDLAIWKNYLLTQGWDDRNMHLHLTGSIHLVTRATNRVSEFPPPGFEPRTDSSSLTTQDLVNTSPGGPWLPVKDLQSPRLPIIRNQPLQEWYTHAGGSACVTSVDSRK